LLTHSCCSGENPRIWLPYRAMVALWCRVLSWEHRLWRTVGC
jgi:hypothetical protein